MSSFKLSKTTDRMKDHQSLKKLLETREQFTLKLIILSDSFEIFLPKKFLGFLSFYAHSQSSLYYLMCSCLTEHLAEHGVVQVGVLQGQSLPLIFSPHHEGVHGPADPLLAPRGLPVARARGRTSRLGQVWTLSPWTGRERNPRFCSPHAPAAEAVGRTAVPGEALLETHLRIRSRTRGSGRPGAPERHPAGMQKSLSGQAGLR